MRSSSSLQRMVALMDQWTMPRARELSLSPVCVAIKQVLYFNRVIVLTAITSFLFFIMSMTVGIDAMLQGETQ